MHGAMTPRNNTLQQHTATLHEDDHTWRLTQRDARHSNTPQQLLQSWLWTPTDYLFLSSNLSTFYLPIDHPISPSLTSTTQTPIVCLHFYCSSLCIISHPSFHMVDIPNAPFHLLLLYHTTPDLVPIHLVIDRPLWTSPVYIRRPLLRKLGLKPDLVQS